VHSVTAEQANEDAEGLFEPVDATPGRVERDSGGGVFGLIPTGAEAELESSAGDRVQGRCLVSQQRRVAVVVAEHHRPQVQAGGRRRRGGEGAERGKLRSERSGHKVVSHEKHVDATVFHPPREVQPDGGMRCGFIDHSETQRSE
jgi:hypothetical protein